MNKEWKTIKGFENYEVSSDGEVRNITTGRILKSRKNNSGYYFLGLCKDGKCHNFLVHRLVATAFIPNQYELPEVNHIDEDKSNNSVDNLAWCTREFNQRYSIKKVTEALKDTTTILSKIAMYKGNELIAIYDNQSEAARLLNFSSKGINRCVVGKRKTYMGYRWVRYYE